MQADVIAIERFGERDARACRERMIVAHHDHERIASVVLDVQLARIGVAGTDAEIGEAFVDGFDDAAARPLLEIDLHALVQRLERAQIFRQKFGDRRQGRHHPHIAEHAASMTGQFDADALDVAQHPARVMQQRFAGRRQCHAARVALE